MSTRKFAIIPLSGNLEDVNYNKVFELGFCSLPIKASDCVERSNTHYLYEPHLIGSTRNDAHYGYMWVEDIDNTTGIATAFSAFGKHQFIEIK